MRINDFFDGSIENLHIAVIGDLILDEYLSGEVTRISPEAAVPVNVIKSRKFVPGGAANTAANLAGLGVNVHMAGVYGHDQNGSVVHSLLKALPIDMSGVLLCDDIETTTKIRVQSGGHQMIRLDFEKVRPIDEAVEEKIFQWVNDLSSRRLHAIILSDYAKGVMTESLTQRIISLGKEKGIPVIVDPKGKNWEKYKGAFGITPNIKELAEGIGYVVNNEDASVEAAGQFLRKKYALDYVFITRSEKGLSCISNESSIHKESVTKEVFDVSGAGDTVVAVLTTAIVMGLSMEDALVLANTAAGVAISKSGTYCVKKEEIWEAISEKSYQIKKVLTWEEAKAHCDQWKRQGDSIVFTNGCFDLLHRGHLIYLKQAAALGDHLIVGLNSDRSVKALKGVTRPVNNQEERAFMLLALPYIDEVVIFDEDTPVKLLSYLKPDILVKGGDYKVEDVAGKEYVKEVRILPFVEGYSTTMIIEKMKK